MPAMIGKVAPWLPLAVASLGLGDVLCGLLNAKEEPFNGATRDAPRHSPDPAESVLRARLISPRQFSLS